MRSGTLILFVVALALGVLAMLGVRFYIESETRNAATAEMPKEPVIVAARDIRFGEPIEPELLETRAWPAGEAPVGTFRSTDDLLVDGKRRYARGSITAGEPILENRVTPPGVTPTLSAALSPGMRAVTIRVNDVLGVAGLVTPGDTVDVMLARTETSAERAEASVDILLQSVKVLAIDQHSEEAATPDLDLKTVTLEVTPSEAQKLALASEIGRLSLALRGLDRSTETAQRVTLRDLPGFERERSAPKAETTTEPTRSASARAPQPVTINVYRGTELSVHEVQ